jgi:hypothetical protein
MIPPQEKTMPPRKSLDIDADLAALQARADKLRAYQKLMLGELVLETGVHKLLDADQIRDALIRARDQAKATPAPQEDRHDAGGTFPAPPPSTAGSSGQTGPEPARHRPPDLLAGVGPGRAGPRPAPEGASLDRGS